MEIQRTRVLFGVLGFAALLAVGGWVASLRVESPADVAARAAPPTPSPILVPVEERVLSSNIVTRGTARFGLPQPISIVPSALKAKAGLITTLPLRNTQLREGGVMLTASGRPVFVFQGKIPAYRDLVPGMSGDDVRQLEQGLNRLRFDPGPVDGTYDERTSAAVTQWYTSAGFEPFGPTPDQLAAAAAAAAARRAVGAARARAEHANKAAAAEIQAMIAERALIVLDPRQPETARAAAEAKLELARAAARKAQLEGELEVQAALDAQEAAVRNAKLAADRIDRLAADGDISKRTLDVQVPADEIVFIPTLPVRVQEVTAIDEQALGIKATGVVARVADTPGTHGVDGYHIYFEVRVDKTPTRLEGFSLRLTIPIKSTKGVVTVVPLSALSLAADGTSRVQVARDGALEYIVVKPGLSADGFVEVTPVNGTLAPGQLVVVGYKNPENRDLQ